MLEEQMQELRELPARVADVELQIVHLREEMRESFSAIRTELAGKVEDLRVEMHGIGDEIRTEIHGIRDKLLVEIRSGDRETQNFMKVLFEHHQSTLKTIGEGTPKRKR